MSSFSSSSSRKSIVDEYINSLNEKCEKQMPSIICSSGKVGDNMIIPTIVEPTCLLKYNYSVVQLKSIAKIYKLRGTDSKHGHVTGKGS